MSKDGYGRSRWARDGLGDSSDWLMKWNGVVEDASKYRPSMDPMHPSVKYGSIIGAIGRAEAAQLGLVLPHRAAAAVLVAHLAHHVDHGRELP